MALSITRHPADAEDLVQDTLLRAYRAIGRFDGRFDGRYPRAWLLTIMRNAQVNRVRRRRPGLLCDPDAGAQLLKHQRPHDSAEQVVVGEASDATVEDALGGLPVKFRRVVGPPGTHPAPPAPSSSCAVSVSASSPTPAPATPRAPRAVTATTRATRP